MVKQLLVISLNGISMEERLFLEASCVDSYIDGYRVVYNNFYNEVPFILLFVICGIAISVVCYVIKVWFDYICL